MLIHVEEVNPEQTALTRDVDLMVLGLDLEWIKSVAAKQGFRFRHLAGVDMLIFGDAEPARNAVHLILRKCVQVIEQRLQRSNRYEKAFTVGACW